MEGRASQVPTRTSGIVRKPRPLAGEISGPSCTQTGEQMVPKHWISHRKHRGTDADPAPSGCHHSSHEGPHGNLTLTFADSEISSFPRVVRGRGIEFPFLGPEDPNVCRIRHINLPRWVR